MRAIIAFPPAFCFWPLAARLRPAQLRRHCRLPSPSPPSPTCCSTITASRCWPASNADERFEPASLTKLMTAYLMFGALKQKKLEARPDRAGLRDAPGKPRARACSSSRASRSPWTNCMHGMIMQSGNDACIALAEADRRQRRSVRADDEPGGAAPRHEEHQLHERHRPARPAALFDRPRSGPAGRRR